MSGQHTARSQAAADGRTRIGHFVADAAAPAAASASSGDAGASPASASEPAWAQRMRRKQQATHAAMTTAHVLRSGDHAGGGTGPSLRDDSSS